MSVLLQLSGWVIKICAIFTSVNGAQISNTLKNLLRF